MVVGQYAEIKRRQAKIIFTFKDLNVQDLIDITLACDSVPEFTMWQLMRILEGKKRSEGASIDSTLAPEELGSD